MHGIGGELKFRTFVFQQCRRAGLAIFDRERALMQFSHELVRFDDELVADGAELGGPEAENAAAAAAGPNLAPRIF